MASVAGLGGGSNLDGICRFVMPQRATLGEALQSLERQQGRHQADGPAHDVHL